MYTSANIIAVITWVIKYGRTRCLGKVAHPGAKRQKERNNLEDADVNGRIILKGTLKRGMWTRLIWLRPETSGGIL